MVIDMAAYMRERRANRRNKLIEQFGHRCQKCGSKGIEFDHIDRTQKCFTLSGRGLDGPWERIVREAAKCQLLCIPCHRKKTRQYGETGGGHNKIVNPEHGTAVLYNQGCRCEYCRTWKREYRAGRLDSLGNIPE